MKQKKPELLAPVGNKEMLIAAVTNGANAVYFGLDKLNMRAKAKNFSLDNLSETVNYCKQNNVDTHLTLNSIVFNNELEQLDEILPEVKKAGIDLVICWDFAVINKCIKYDIPFCISTQASISNVESAKFYKNLGAKRIVLARECTLDMVKEIKEKVDVEVETFIHGAMCVAVSGRCFMSHYVFNKSANRGECVQPCRRNYKIIDNDQGFSFELGDDYVMSPKDICTIDFIDLLIDAKIDAFKIEGRKRSPEYIAKVVSTYRKAIDNYFEGIYTDDKKIEYKKELSKVYNRGFSNGFYLGLPDGNDFATTYGSTATTRKEYIGKVINYFKKTNVVHAHIEAGDLSVGDSIYISGETTGIIELKVDTLLIDGVSVTDVKKGEKPTFVSPSVVRERDKIYKIIEK
jgi:putative protease